MCYHQWWPTYQTDNQTVTDVVEDVLAIRLKLRKTHLEVTHSCKAGDLTCTDQNREPWSGQDTELTSRVTKDEATHGHHDTQDK